MKKILMILMVLGLIGCKTDINKPAATASKAAAEQKSSTATAVVNINIREAAGQPKVTTDGKDVSDVDFDPTKDDFGGELDADLEDGEDFNTIDHKSALSNIGMAEAKIAELGDKLEGHEKATEIKATLEIFKAKFKKLKDATVAAGETSEQNNALYKESLKLLTELSTFGILED